MTACKSSHELPVCPALKVYPFKPGIGLTASLCWHVQVVYPLGLTHVAMRAMSQAKHVGKIVAQVTGPNMHQPTSGMTLIPGGLGALGAVVGTHLAAQAPCTHLALLGRSGRLPSVGNHSMGTHSVGAEMLQQSAAEVVLARCDASDRSEVQGVLRFLSRSAGSRACMPGMTGLLQSGGVLEDAMLASVTLQVPSLITPVSILQ